MGVNLSVLILAKNEEKNIEACIRSALFADEVLVIDDMSSDRTKEIAESLGAKVLQRALNGNWGEQQTFAMQNAKCDWIYCLDADERISHRLAEAGKKFSPESFAHRIEDILTGEYHTITPAQAADKVDKE